MAKLWQKNYSLNELIEKFTVGIDYILDQNLIVPDCVASIAHANMLRSINILTGDEFDNLRKELVSIIKDVKAGSFEINLSDEDCHTAIENRLVEKLGETGKKIHTGRSRNDQVLAATRLYTKAALLDYMKSVMGLVESLLVFADKNKDVPMPGRTHMQIAMPSSVGLWAASFAEAMIDDLNVLSSVFKLNDQCPLGSAASYGVPIPLNREMVSETLGFAKLQNNVLYVNNSRGKFEAAVLDAMEYVALSLSKMAQDLIIFSMPEFGYFNLPDDLCSGSSIMPQKKNPDGLELVRAKAASFSSYSMRIKSVLRSLPSGYNRDFQETKEPLVAGMNSALAMVEVMKLTIDKMLVNEDNLKKGFIKEIYATDKALELVLEGKSFRDAYKEVGLSIDSLSDRDPVETIKNRKSAGCTGNLCLEKTRNELDRLVYIVSSEIRKLNKTVKLLTGEELELL